MNKKAGSLSFNGHLILELRESNRRHFSVPLPHPIVIPRCFQPMDRPVFSPAQLGSLDLN
jgi:hypothetical protein